jgi:hypothetical protein
MTVEQKIIRNKVGSLELAKQLGNVSQACESPSLYLIPFIAWNQPDSLLVSRDYEGKKSKPEWV